MGDLHGRKLPFILCVLAGAILYVPVLFIKDVKIMIGMFFLLGFTLAGRFSMAHVYL
jgi:hypothetical protein